ncbi:MAG TPA: VWA domain-containing protein [Herpetosiphon sp.]|uniref:von Willebrand factor type A n=1 Tax=Herpetosiphon aurantiacus (strain ATCC 23779 / DSM 785 / 114-95) TaxID=316274 RepID=A9B367_HERA2|nr:VWA domain-containing protein [Herpetosiphon sp.]ABX07530.1 von Willebrand factor type A [Herpetosiphon aurantiacus DSM 785]HBW49216.1 VWA domain-containing protein [Herpetosiphon sp.]
MALVPANLWLLLVLLPLAGVFWLARRAEERDRAALGDPGLIASLLSMQPARQRRIRIVLQLSAVGLIIVALARPVWGSGDETLKRSGLQVLILLDGSRSMAAQDVRPSRIDASKRMVLALLDRLEGNQVGMLMFGSSSYVQFPLTSDLAAARSLVEPINPRGLSLGGTDVEEVITEGLRSFPIGQIEGRTMILITDGGDSDEQSDGEAVAAAREAAKMGLTIHTIGMATEAGGQIPIYDDLGNISYVEDQGQRVISKLNRPLLEQIASATGGTYFDGSTLDLNQLQTALDQSAPVDLTDQTRRVYSERFYIFAGLAFILLVADVFVGRLEQRKVVAA